MRYLNRKSPRRGQGRSKASRATRRRPPSRLAVLRSPRALLLAAGLAAAGTLAGLWMSGWIERQVLAAVDAGYRATARGGLAVADVLVEGRVRSDGEAILAALEVERGSPILALDLGAARARLEALPWVRAAALERRLPDTIFVRLEERRPFALWQLNGNLAVIDQDGTVIDGAPVKEHALLPLVVGPGANSHVAEVVGLVDSEPELKPLVTAAVRVSERRWNVRLKGGIDVRLPEAKASAAWSSLARLEREHGLLQHDVIAIDLRLPDRPVVRTAPGKRKDKGRDT